MTAGSLPLSFDRAIRNKNVAEAWRLARQFQFPNGLSLARGLDLTILLGQKGDDRHEPAARRFLIRFLIETEPGLKQVKRAVCDLDDLLLTTNLPALQEEAVRSLEDLARQIRER